MKKVFFRGLILFFALSMISCGYRFVDPSPGGNYALAEVRNVTSEPDLDTIMTQALHDLGSFNPKGDNTLTVIVTDFQEGVAAVSSSGMIVRERLKIEVQWKIIGSDGSRGTFSRESFSKTYPYSNDPVTLNWNRSAAIRLLINSAADYILGGLGEYP